MLLNINFYGKKMYYYPLINMERDINFNSDIYILSSKIPDNIISYAAKANDLRFLLIPFWEKPKLVVGFLVWTHEIDLYKLDNNILEKHNYDYKLRLAYPSIFQQLKCFNCKKIHDVFSLDWTFLSMAIADTAIVDEKWNSIKEGTCKYCGCRLNKKIVKFLY